MVEMINTKEKIIRYLHNNNISFWKLDHPPAASAGDLSFSVAMAPGALQRLEKPLLF